MGEADEDDIRRAGAAKGRREEREAFISLGAHSCAFCSCNTQLVCGEFITVLDPDMCIDEFL